MNIAVSDVLLSIAGVFRGLGIINSKFVGAPDSTTTPYCVAFTFYLKSLGHSATLTLLPLTIDRVIAILLPLHHRAIVTHKTCAFMFGANWLPIFGLLLFYIVTYTTGVIRIPYHKNYHRCVISGVTFGELHEEFVLITTASLLIILMYVMMLFVIVRNTDRIGRFLFTATLIVTTNLLAYMPTVITNTWNISLSYEVSQILTIDLPYINSVINPVIYVATHPTVQEFAKTWMTNKTNQVTQQPVDSSGSEPLKSRRKPAVSLNSSPL